MTDRKKSRKEREKELRDLSSDGRGCGFKKDLVADRHLDDQRYERELALKEQASKQSSKPTPAPMVTQGGPPPSATLDALIRMEAGLGQRTIMDNINDPNRPTWEDYKKAKADKLDLAGADERKMMEYRAQLDAERERRLAQNRGEKVKDDKKKKDKKKKKEKKHKKEKKRKKEKKHKKESRKRKRESGSGSSKKRKREEGDGEGEEGEGGEGRDSEKDKKKRSSSSDGSSSSSSSSEDSDGGGGGGGGGGNDSESSGPVKLSDFLRKGKGGGGSDSD